MFSTRSSMPAYFASKALVIGAICSASALVYSSTEPCFLALAIVAASSGVTDEALPTSTDAVGVAGPPEPADPPQAVRTTAQAAARAQAFESEIIIDPPLFAIAPEL